MSWHCFNPLLHQQGLVWLTSPHLQTLCGLSSLFLMQPMQHNIIYNKIPPCSECWHGSSDRSPTPNLAQQTRPPGGTAHCQTSRVFPWHRPLFRELYRNLPSFSPTQRTFNSMEAKVLKKAAQQVPHKPFLCVYFWLSVIWIPLILKSDVASNQCCRFWGLGCARTSSIVQLAGRDALPPVTR